MSVEKRAAPVFCLPTFLGFQTWKTGGFIYPAPSAKQCFSFPLFQAIFEDSSETTSFLYDGDNEGHFLAMSPLCGSYNPDGEDKKADYILIYNYVI